MGISFLQSDGGLILLFVSVINFAGAILNAVYIVRINKIKTDRELLENLTDQNKAKDELLKDYREEIDHLRKHKATCVVRHA